MTVSDEQVAIILRRLQELSDLLAQPPPSWSRPPVFTEDVDVHPARLPSLVTVQRLPNKKERADQAKRRQAYQERHWRHLARMLKITKPKRETMQLIVAYLARATFANDHDVHRTLAGFNLR